MCFKWEKYTSLLLFSAENSLVNCWWYDVIFIFNIPGKTWNSLFLNISDLYVSFDWANSLFVITTTYDSKSIIYASTDGIHWDVNKAPVPLYKLRSGIIPGIGTGLKELFKTLFECRQCFLGTNQHKWNVILFHWLKFLEHFCKYNNCCFKFTLLFRFWSFTWK